MARNAGVLTAQRADEIAKQLFFYAYPLVLMDVTRRQMTNYAEPPAEPPGSGPHNRLIHLREFPDPRFRVVVRANLDTLYSLAWLDLADEPLVLSVPPIERYFMLPLLSMWTDVFAAPGTRTSGECVAGDYAIVGPTFRGELPAGLQLIRAPTRYVWLLGRTQTNGTADYATAHAIQDRYRLVPLSDWGKPKRSLPKGKIDPTVDTATPPPLQVERMDAASFYARFASLLSDNPPYFFDHPLVQQMARLGLRAGREFALSQQSELVRSALSKSFQRGLVALEAEAARLNSEPGWHSLRGGFFGNDYTTRAIIARVGLGANLEQDAIYTAIGADADGELLRGENCYRLRFPRGGLPPVEAFWSLTVYDSAGYLYPNPSERCALRDRDHLAYDADGSLSVLLQNEAPGPERQNNWLPVPKAPFNLMLRMYWPRQPIVDGTWKPPLPTRESSTRGRPD